MNALIFKLMLGFFFNVVNLAPITGAGATVAISSSAARANWIQVIAPSGNASNVMFGDSTTTATTGLPIAPGAGYNTPTCANCVYTPSAHFVYVANGDKAYLAFGN
jgi:hypothetical protein